MNRVWKSELGNCGPVVVLFSRIIIKSTKSFKNESYKDSDFNPADVFHLYYWVQAKRCRYQSLC